MTFVVEALKSKPTKVRDIPLPRRTIFRTDEAGNAIGYTASPVDWASEVLYFLLPDRFSDGLDRNRPAFDFTQPAAAARPNGFRWDRWAESGGARWQGGTLKGIASRLDYLSHLGITAIWIGPIFKQRKHSDEYHGYAIQNFLDVDPHFGTREDLVNLVIAAHDLGIRVILDVVFNHSARNWDYAGDIVDPPYRPWPGFYERGSWLTGTGDRAPSIADLESGVWPEELQRDTCYTRAGKGSLAGAFDIDDDHSEARRTDFDGSFRDFNFDDMQTLNDIARCYKYWIALTDIDGMRLDTLKHVPKEAARNFCGAIKEFAANLGKADFFLVGEVAGSDDDANKYLDALELNLNATLDIGNSRILIGDVAKGLVSASEYFYNMQPWNPILGSHRNSAQRHVKIVDDHDEVAHLEHRRVRISSDASSNHQVAAAVALDLLTLGIPCVYYGDEQAFAGPEKSERDQFLPDYGDADKYLRETMFGAPHPRKKGAAGLPDEGSAGFDTELPGFGAFGTTGHHFFNEDHPAYKRIQHLIGIRKQYPALRYGRQYLREIGDVGSGESLRPSEAGDLVAWSRILDEEEILCVINSHGASKSPAIRVRVDAALNAPSSIFTVIANSAEAAQGTSYTGSHKIGSTVVVRPVNTDNHDNDVYVELSELGPSEVLVLSNKT